MFNKLETTVKDSFDVAVVIGSFAFSVVCLTKLASDWTKNAVRPKKN